MPVRRAAAPAAKPPAAPKPAKPAKPKPAKPATPRGAAGPLKPPPKPKYPGITGSATGKPPKTVLDEARWRRIVQRSKTRGEVRAYIEGNRPGGLNPSTERRVFQAYATRQRATQFLTGLTQRKAPLGVRPMRVSGLEELNKNFMSRKVGGTGSTARGVAARNRIYDEQRRQRRRSRK